MATTIPSDPSNGNSTYTFASKPRAVSGQRKKYRDPLQADNQAPVGTNMMHDPRIVRGSTLRRQPATTIQEDPLEAQKRQEQARRRQAKKRATQKARPRSPQAVDGRKHMDVQTELYLEELTDRVEETEIATQTDAFLDRPPSPLFIPPKTGVDATTQIEDGELFDFDQEVKPILEVLIGKTMEQSLMEVMEEEELDRLRDHQREFEELRSAELAEVQRMEEQARRREEEKDKRMAEQRQAVLAQKATAEKIAARAFAQSYLSDLVPSVFTSLNEGGFFFDRSEREIESQFIPWLMGEVESQLGLSSMSRMLLDDLIRSALTKLASSSGAAAEPQTQAKELESYDKEPESDDKELVHGDDGGDDAHDDEAKQTAEPDVAINEDTEEPTQGDLDSSAVGETETAAEEDAGAETTAKSGTEQSATEDGDEARDVEPRGLSLADETKA